MFIRCRDELCIDTTLLVLIVNHNGCEIAFMNILINEYDLLV